jgi:hypothetical protein
MLLFVLPPIAEMTDMYHQCLAYRLSWGLENFLPGLASNCDPLNFVSQVAGITDMSHHTWPF